MGNQALVTKDTASKSAKSDRLVNPKKATILAIIPGLGQIYNGELWKAPIVYASLGGSIFAYHLNSIKYQDFLKAYLSFYDMGTGNLGQGIDHDTPKPVIVRNTFNTKATLALLTVDQVARRKNVWRRYRNVSVLAIGIIYGLSIIEANVAAHLKTFDISDDISVRISLSPLKFTSATFIPGVQVVFNFK
ncbi:hypothetical protein D3C87_1629680 [compost metagenome]